MGSKSCLNQTKLETWNRVSPMYVECKTQRVFAKACLGIKLAFHTENCDYFI